MFALVTKTFFERVGDLHFSASSGIVGSTSLRSKYARKVSYLCLVTPESRALPRPGPGVRPGLGASLAKVLIRPARATTVRPTRPTRAAAGRGASLARARRRTRPARATTPRLTRRATRVVAGRGASLARARRRTRRATTVTRRATRSRATRLATVTIRLA